MSETPNSEQLYHMMNDIVMLGPDELLRRLKEEARNAIENMYHSRSTDYAFHIQTRVLRWKYAATAFHMQQQYTQSYVCSLPIST